MNSLSDSMEAFHPQPAEGNPSALERCVGDVSEFARTTWGRSPLVRRDEEHPHPGNEAATRFADVFTLRQLDEFVSMSARVPTVRMVLDGSPLPVTRYCTPVRLGGRELDDVVDPRKVVTRLGEGATLVAQSLHRTVPSVAAFVADLQEEISHPVQANAYLTPPEAQGLTIHSDRHDVLAVQLAGSKSWWVEGLGDIELAAGDTLYMPIGTRHSASTTGETSLHLTLGIIRVSARNVLERLLGTESAVLERPMPVGYRHLSARHDLATVLDEALDRALDTVGGADLDDIMDAEQRRRLEPPMVAGRIESLARIGRLGLDSVVRWAGAEPKVRPSDTSVAPARPSGEVDGGTPPIRRITADLGDRTVTLPAAALPALQLLATGLPILVRDLPGLDEPSRVVLARRLIREAACVEERLVAVPEG